MAKKLTQKEWNEKFNKEFTNEIDEFRHDDDRILYGSVTITDAIKVELNVLRTGCYPVKMEINKLEDYGNRTEFTLTDYNGVQLFITEYHNGELSIGVCDRRKIVLGHVKKIYDDKLPSIIHWYFSLFKSTMDSRNVISKLTEIAGKRNI